MKRLGLMFLLLGMTGTVQGCEQKNVKSAQGCGTCLSQCDSSGDIEDLMSRRPQEMYSKKEVEARLSGLRNTAQLDFYRENVDKLDLASLEQGRSHASRVFYLSTLIATELSTVEKTVATWNLLNKKIVEMGGKNSSIDEEIAKK